MYDDIKKILKNHGIDMLIDEDIEFDDLITDIVIEINKEFG